MTKEEIRLACLQIAAHAGVNLTVTQVIEIAKAFEAYVNG